MEITLNQHIQITSDVRNGKPRIAGRRISVADVVIMYLRMGQSLEEIASTYNLSLASLYAAISYYYDHQATIDQQIREDDAFVQAFMQDRPSRLQQKLKALCGE